ATQLDRLYAAVKEAQADPEFYTVVHQYCDLVMKNPTLRAILDESEQAYRLGHVEIWREPARTDKESDEKSEMVMRLERFNMFSEFTLPMMRIYYPLDDYIHDLATEDKQDPLAIVMIRGLKVALKYNKWDKKTLQSFNRWFGGKRSMYQTSIRKFHTMLLAALWTKNSEIAPVHPRPPITFNPRTGDFYVNGTYGTFNPKSQEAKVFGVLYDSPDHFANYPDLIRSYRPTVEEATKSQKDDLFSIINSIKEKLGDQRDVIKNIRNSAYRIEIPNSNNDQE
ncbi:MAG: hypothetical protein ABIQ91_04480, partial [Candidatus Paceibacterota bacterium]